MANKLSSRLQEIVDALPLKEGMRILEIGCGSGAAAREVAKRVPGGSVLGIDRSSKAIRQAIENNKAEIASGVLAFRTESIENFELQAGEEQFNFAFAVRVGALDGRHPEIERQATEKIRKALKRSGKLYIDGGNPLKLLDIRDR
ncbi:class I SAM-dependent methyltransferase [Dyadobacter sp. CY107]|uniref:SAM-dependent methyltransferase n=1 Tax=Dyadobacter fanqingshengii TaxID=2906443 RepID=UPI001F221A4F|nr:class I SAM-dependent methyltransferase [Dyadobacter fanqingshengii]MCF2505259.1 class I SAM-dependent methyltransferase [Dyadobacter fanqingshengii]